MSSSSTTSSTSTQDPSTPSTFTSPSATPVSPAIVVSEDTANAVAKCAETSQPNATLLEKPGTLLEKSGGGGGQPRVSITISLVCCRYIVLIANTFL
jgi:hypothetical protein